jgi:hypothetical protein
MMHKTHHVLDADEGDKGFCGRGQGHLGNSSLARMRIAAGPVQPKSQKLVVSEAILNNMFSPIVNSVRYSNEHSKIHT